MTSRIGVVVLVLSFVASAEARQDKQEERSRKLERQVEDLNKTLEGLRKEFAESERFTKALVSLPKKIEDSEKKIAAGSKPDEKAVKDAIDKEIRTTRNTLDGDLDKIEKAHSELKKVVDDFKKKVESKCKCIK